MSALTFFAASITSALVAAIWQGLLLAAVVALCLRLVPTLTAAARSLVWLTVAALAVLLHFTRAAAPTQTTHPALHPGLSINAGWSLVIATIWAAASLFRAVQLVIGAVALHRLAGAATPISAPDATCAALLVRSRRAESTPAQLCTSVEVDRPSVLGFFRPRILLPAGLVETLAPAELQQVLLHELEHLRRRDDWTNLLGRLALVAFPLNPVLLWLERRLATERELACDDRVLEATGARKAYATCLAHLAEHTLVGRSLSLALGLIGIHTARTSRPQPARSELARRVSRILALPTQTLNPRVSSALVAVLIAVATGGSIELAHSPQLIHFTSPGAELTATNSTRTTGQFVSAAYHPHTNTSPFVLTKAVLTSNCSSVPCTPTTLTLTKTPYRVTKHHLRAITRRSVPPQTPFVRLTSFYPQAHNAHAADGLLSLTLTVATPKQFSYAAVPVHGGWILVLLPVQAAQPSLTLKL